MPGIRSIWWRSSLHRRHHGAAGQDLPHHGLLDMSARTQDDGCRTPSPDQADDLQQGGSRSQATWATSRCGCARRPAMWMRPSAMPAASAPKSVRWSCLTNSSRVLLSQGGIYPVPQAVPSAYLIDMEHCLGNNPVACGKCVDACEKHCIDLNMQDKIVELEVGTIIVATGMDIYDPTAARRIRLHPV